LRDRFGVVSRLDYYNDGELRDILARSAAVLGVAVHEEGIWEISRRSRGTPRVANRLLRRVRDYAQVRADGIITQGVADRALRLLEVDELGMDVMDRKLLLTIIEKFSGGPVGIETLSSAISEERDTIEDIYEPFLMQRGFLDRTPRGRVVTLRAYEHFGRVPSVSGSDTAQGHLWQQEEPT
jgi:Holliday junction DNA helicase RuvB